MKNRLPNIDWDPSKPPRELLNEELKMAVEHLKLFVKPELKEVPAYMIVLGIKLRGVDRAVVQRDGVLITTIDENRHKMIFEFGQEYAKKLLPITAVFVVPAWCSDMRSKDSEEQIDGELYVPPSKDPNRSEVLMITGATFDRQTASIMLPCYRAEDGCVRVAWGEANSTMDAHPYLLYRFFEGAAIALKDYKPGNKTNE
jgi:hypothetical protein